MPLPTFSPLCHHDTSKVTRQRRLSALRCRQGGARHAQRRCQPLLGGSPVLCPLSPAFCPQRSPRNVRPRASCDSIDGERDAVSEDSSVEILSCHKPLTHSPARQGCPLARAPNARRLRRSPMLEARRVMHGAARTMILPHPRREDAGVRVGSSVPHASRGLDPGCHSLRIRIQARSRSRSHRRRVRADIDARRGRRDSSRLRNVWLNRSTAAARGALTRGMERWPQAEDPSAIRYLASIEAPSGAAAVSGDHDHDPGRVLSMQLGGVLGAEHRTWT
ncbi:hypothetical protein GSI_14934 [Ganoderma sinense ZZ0214-1]|uniref:Uncharacterized protein n=1 Tax=Ganoderma sinense ZZ0214-1 TaxID=1077348 RepID=A0A2G8RQ49_9APHY|nr:hypothetical protein GSI_14934 [Ganoderma sinense ZZ0214-1]